MPPSILVAKKSLLRVYSVPFILIGYVICILVAITTFFLPESPCWLVNRKMYDEADKVWDYIAKFNGKKYSLNQDFFATKIE